MDTLNGKIRIVEEGGHFLEDEGSQHLLFTIKNARLYDKVNCIVSMLSVL